MERRISEITSATEYKAAQDRLAELADELRGNCDRVEVQKIKEEMDELSEMVADYESSIAGFFGEDDY